MTRRRRLRFRLFALLSPLLIVVPALAHEPGQDGPRANGTAAEDAAPADAAVEPLVDPELLKPLEFRSIGPLRGGRSTAVTGIASEPLTFLAGTTGGGVWKTSDAGLTWNNISDGFFDVASVGAIDVADSDPNVIYVGTGSACIRGNASTGRGIYRSTDGGKSWKHIGLTDSGSIGRIEVHPNDPDVAFVAVLGHPFGPSDERGVFRTTDGGDTWEKVLFVSDEVGAIDLSLNPANPRHVYAAMWRFERKPWTFVDASEDGGIYKSTDGGDTWNKLGGGLPEGLTGRIGVSVSPANPDRVYALVSAADPEGGLYRSDDAGASWQRINRDRDLRQRHWYYSHVEADPQDPDTVYIMNVRMWRSIDGGVTLEQMRSNHGDTHSLWINPDNPELMVLGDDGGGEVSTNRGATWSSVLNQPTAEMYRVAVDNQFPYRVYGGQQDNSTISLRSDGRGMPQDWYSVGGCESGHVAVDPRNANVSYAGCYIGEITRYDHSSSERRAISVYPVLVDGVAPRDLTHRFQWNAPIVISRYDPNVLYHTSQTVNRSTDEGNTWEVISPDLTRNDAEKQELPGGPLQHDHTSVEVYSTVFVLSESAHGAGELWAGADDGLVHVTREDGASWQNVTPPDMPVDATVNSIDVSTHRPGRVTVAAHRFRMDDWAPYVFRTEDGGETWRSLADGTNGIPADSPVRVVREDPDREGLLYAGTEFGMYASFDDGEHWQKLQLNLPITPITDLLIHEQDLVVATQGRGFWILDDLTLLHQLTDEVAAADSWLFVPRPAIRTAGRGGRPAVLRYKLPAAPEDSDTDPSETDTEAETAAALEILDSSGTVVRSWSTEGEDDDKLTAEPGMNVTRWTLRSDGADLPEGAIAYLGYTGGPVMLPGAYTARLTVNGSAQEQPFEILPDPRRDDVTAPDLEAQLQLATRVRDLLRQAYTTLASLRGIRTQANAVAARTAEVEGGEAIGEQAEAIATALGEIEEKLIQTKAESRQDPINFPPMLDTQISYLYRYVMGNYGRPNAAAYARLDEIAAQLAELEQRLQAVIVTEVAAFNTAVDALDLGAVIISH